MSFIFIIALTFCVEIASTAFNIEDKNRWGRNFIFVCTLAAGQGLMYLLGSLLGGTFMHTVERFSEIVVIVLCFVIAFRMILDTLKIKSGKNLFLIDDLKHLVFLAIALGFNALIAGLMANEPFLPLFGKITPLYIIAASLCWGIIGISTKFSPIKLIINSLINMIMALAVLASGIMAII